MTCQKCADRGYIAEIVDHWVTRLTSCDCAAGKAWAKMYGPPEWKRVPSEGK